MTRPSARQANLTTRPPAAATSHGETVLGAGAVAPIVGVWLPSPAKSHCATTTQTRMAAQTATTCALLEIKVLTDDGTGTLMPPCRGRRPTRRAAISPRSDRAKASLGSVAIRLANRSAAAFAGSCANLAASFQGSRSNRTSAETTLSNTPCLSSPTGAKRNASNSESRRTTGAERMISVTGFFAPIGCSEPSRGGGTAI
jgi:hypothetical protein